MRQHPSTWALIRNKAHIIFPLLGAASALCILVSPFFGAPLSYLAANSFVRFCLFWFFSLSIVLSFANRLVRPSVVALGASCTSVLLSFVYAAIFTHAATEPTSLATLSLACIAGGILGALAGTWLVYVLEVYAKK